MKKFSNVKLLTTTCLLMSGLLAFIVCGSLYSIRHFKEKAEIKRPISVEGELLYSYAVLSDVHMFSTDGIPSDGIVKESETGYRESVSDFNRAIERINLFDLEFAFITGDVGYVSSADELTLYKNAIANSQIPYYPVRGNHDTGFSDLVWQEATGVAENFEILKGDDVFLGMSMYESNTPSVGTKETSYESNGLWLQEKLQEYKGKRIYLFMHLPFPNSAGLLDGHEKYDAYGFTADSEEAAALFAAIQDADNVTVFSGHTHFEFAVESAYPIVNVHDLNKKNVNLVHVPSVAYPRDKQGDEVQSKSQCYIVDVYTDKTVLYGYDLVSGNFLTEYVYILYNDGSVEHR